MNGLSRLASSIHEEWQSLPKPPSPVGSRVLYATALLNSSQNRYPDVLPFESTRVKLSDPKEYINASYVNIFENGNFISTQAPLPHTFNTFWKMVWENKSPVIVMLTKIMEKRKIKAHCYWPALGETEIFGDISVTLVSETQEKFITIRNLEIQCEDEVHCLCHLQYTEWPDFGVPRSTNTIRHLLELTNEYREQYTTNKDDTPGTVVVHCSAGIGRCGTFLAIQSVLEKLNANEPPSTISVKEIVTSLREFRMAMVQTKEQYKFIYHVLEDAARAFSPLSSPLPSIPAEFHRSSSSDRSALTRSYSDFGPPQHCEIYS